MGYFALLGLFALFAVLVGAMIFQALWNSTMPELFHLPTITLWQALKLLLIAGLLTSGGFLRFTITGL